MTLRLPIAALAVLSVVCAPAIAQSDSRHNLRLTPQEQAQFLSRAETDDMDQLAAHLGQTMKQCMACHAAFKAR